jgi:hypothetical protein
VELTQHSLQAAQDNTQARLQNIDGIVNTVMSVNAALCCQLNAAHAELKKYDEVDKRTKAMSAELDKIFDRIDPVLMALINLARDTNTVAEFEQDFKAFLDCHAEMSE